MRFFRPGFLAGCLYPEALFRVKTTEKVLYLTFDDGPDPVSTPQLLDILKRHKVIALFFCNGRAAEKYPVLISRIREGGHMTGNHGYDHLNGLITGTASYLNDVIKASSFTSDRIFRPPYGRMTIRQKRRLKSYKLVFWDLMAYDFDLKFGKENTLQILKDKIRPGSVIVLHDTASSCANVVLEEFIIFAENEGYQFEMIDNIF